MKPIAIVIPWFGADLVGGAELQAFELATRLAARGHKVEVLTTCNQSFHSDWSINHHAPGLNHAHGLTIRRFPVEPRAEAAFAQVNAKLLALRPAALRPGVSPLTPEEARTFNDENIKSPALVAHLRAEGAAYHAFIFLPYMFAHATQGLPLVAARAWLQPCLHDEPQAYLPETAAIFRQARGLLFNSAGEFELAMRLYGPGIYTRSTVVGEGIEPAHYTTAQLAAALPESLRGVPFVLYLGRRDETKNVQLLTRAFLQFKLAQPASALRLVLAGPGPTSYANPAGVLDLGLVSDEVKAALLTHCRALAQPSRHESFSRALMEAWRAGRPVVVHRACPPTAQVVAETGAGWLAADETEWAQTCARLNTTSDEELAALGARGRIYAETEADWNKVSARYEALLDLATQLPTTTTAAKRAVGISSATQSVAPRARLSVHQLLPDIVFGDAISNQALALRAHLRQHGYESEIFVKRCDARLATEAKLFDESQPAPTDALLYHHSIGSELTAFAVAHRGPRCLIYHNITPAEFYEPYRPGFAWLLETGRAHLDRLAPHFPLAVGDSAYNASELAACGFQRPRVLPIIIDPDKWNIAPDAEQMARLQDGRTNILFVGRIAPNKRQDRLVELFAHYRALDEHARLVIAGAGRDSDPYYTQLRARIARLDLAAHVEVTGQITDTALLAYFHTAHLYWSASEHEGFGAPLVEAMWFDVPVLALAATAVSETLGRAGVLYERDEPLASVAARAYQLTHDAALRRTVVTAQRARRLAFTPAAVWPTLAQLVEQLTNAHELQPVA